MLLWRQREGTRTKLQFISGDLRAAWYSMKTMSSVNHMAKALQPMELVGFDDRDLPSMLNSFHSRFKKHDFSHNAIKLKQSLVSKHGLVSSVTDLLKRIHINKAPGEDAICGRIQYYCANNCNISHRSL